MKKILCVGVSVRAMVESAVRSDYPVAALDAFGDQDLRVLAESHSLHADFGVSYSAKSVLEFARRFDFDVLAYTSDLENHPGILDTFAAHHLIAGNSARTVRSARDWPPLFQKLRQAGFPAPDSIFRGDAREPDPERRWLIKPVLSGGGHGISFLRGKAAADARSFIQQYIAGKSCSASFVANGRESVVVGITEQMAGLAEFGAKGFRYCGNILPLPEMLDAGAGRTILEQARRIASFLTAEYGLTGVNGFDFILNGGRVWLTEINPRYSASMELIERAYDLPIFHLHMQAALEGRLPAFDLASRLDKGGFYAKTILFSGMDSRAPDTIGWLGSGLRDIPAPGEKLPQGAPICTIFAGCPSYDGVFAELVGKAAALKEQIYG